eukprot:424564-Prymnesium_polylepis.1
MGAHVRARGCRLLRSSLTRRSWPTRARSSRSTACATKRRLPRPPRKPLAPAAAQLCACAMEGAVAQDVD